LLVFSHPPRNLVSRAMFGTENLLFRLRRTSFRAHLHDPAAMVAAAAHSHLEERYRHRGLGWHVVGLANPEL
jgi:magnesium-protoporphyrin O-methyltransferase